MLFTTGLTDAERERLAWLSEECAEVIQAIGKIQRHGYDSAYDNGITNRAQLAIEIGHVTVAIRLMLWAHDINSVTVTEAENEKLAKDKYFHFQ